MTPEEKGNELIEKFLPNMPYANDRRWAQKCAIIAVEDELDLAENIFHRYGIGFMGSANARNDFEKHTICKELKEILNYLKNINQ